MLSAHSTLWSSVRQYSKYCWKYSSEQQVGWWRLECFSILHLILPLAESKKPFDMGPHEDWANPLIRTEGSLTLHCTWLHLFSGSNFMRCRASSRKCYLVTEKYVISCSGELWCVAYTGWSMTKPDSMLCWCRLCFTKGFMQFTSLTRSQSFHLAKSCERNWEIKCNTILLLSLWNFHVSLCAVLSPKFLTDHSSWAANLI